VPPLVYIESFSVNDEPRSLDGPVRLQRGENNVHFDYAGLSFKDEHNVVFQYRLQGYDPEWSQITSDRCIRYTNLKDGEYVFMVQAGNEDGFWSEKPAELAFVIPPPFWKAWWFALLLLLAVVGTVYLGVQHSIRRVKKRNVELEKLVDQRTVELARLNQELKELSLTDPLTRLRNRRFFAEIIDDEVAQVQRAYGDESRGREPSSENRDLGLAIIDIDHFKQVNDAYGHKAGDEVIKLISDELKSAVRKVDVVVRWGGEEFLVLFRNASRAHVHEMCLRLAERIRNLDMELPNGRKITKTCSIGFSVYPFSASWPEVFNHEEVIGLADRALYVAKNNGRDLVVGVMEGAEEIGDEDKREIKDDLRAAAGKLFIRLVCDRPDLKL
jgi:diguanylate cyclase (GGDEF)-like protein